MDVCSCDVVLGNTGEGKCRKAYLVTKFLLLMALTTGAGVDKTYDVSAGEPTQATLVSDINAVDPRDRVFPVGELESIDDERGDSVFEEFDSGKKFFVRKGFRTFQAFWPKVEPLMEGKLNKFGCQDVGAMMVDAGGNLIFSARQLDGIITTAYPVKIASGTFDATYVKAKEQNVAGLMIQFQWDSSEADAFLRQVQSSQLDWGFTDLKGLVDVTATIGAITLDDDVTITMTDDYGDPVTGLVAGDMAIANLTTPGPVAIDTVTETADGVYLIDYTTAAVGAGQELELTVTSNGFDWSRVKAETWTTV